jgi:tetratricopeptide (TPR) repeat protein
MARPEIQADLDRVSIDEPEDILSALLLNDADVRVFVGEGKRLHTDDNMLVEYQAGRRVGEYTHIIHLSNLYEVYKPTRYEHLSDETNARIRRQAEARKVAMAGTIQRLTGKPDEGLRSYDRAFAMAPNDPYVVSRYAEVHLERADVLYVEGRLDEATAEFRKAVVDPRWLDSWIAYDGLGLIAMSQGDLEGARSNFLSAVGHNPHHGDGYYNLGVTLTALGDTALALRSYEEAMKLDPDDPDVPNILAWLLAEQGRQLDYALMYAQRAVGLRRDADYLDTLGWVYFKRGDLENARLAFEEVLAKEPEKVDTIYHLAVTHRQMGDRARAEELLRTVIRLDRGAFAEKAGVILDELGTE